jgi:hypothetical protein
VVVVAVMVAVVVMAMMVVAVMMPSGCVGWVMVAVMMAVMVMAMMMVAVMTSCWCVSWVVVAVMVMVVVMMFSFQIYITMLNSANNEVLGAHDHFCKAVIFQSVHLTRDHRNNARLCAVNSLDADTESVLPPTLCTFQSTTRKFVAIFQNFVTLVAIFQQSQRRVKG